MDICSDQFVLLVNHRIWEERILVGIVQFKRNSTIFTWILLIWCILLGNSSQVDILLNIAAMFLLTDSDLSWKCVFWALELPQNFIKLDQNITRWGVFFLNPIGPHSVCCLGFVQEIYVWQKWVLPPFKFCLSYFFLSQFRESCFFPFFVTL